jgi:hypothetical protein
MANNPHYTLAIRNAELTALCANADSGILRIYDGAQPANADTALAGQQLLAELTMSATAFIIAAGVATANTVTQDASANNTGTASWFRQFASNGTTVCWDGSVSTSGADCNLDSTSVTVGVPVSITGYTISTSA